MSISKFSHLYLGNSAINPAPVFRDLSPEGVLTSDGTVAPWIEDAVFALEFTRDKFPTANIYSRERPWVWFYDIEGLPVGLPTERRLGLTAASKRQFQVFPMRWQDMGGGSWTLLRERPEVFDRLHFSAKLSRTLLPALPGPSVP